MLKRTYELPFYVKYLERNTHHHPCDADVEKFDQVLINDILSNVSCKPFYIQNKYFDHIPNCSNVNVLDEINIYLALENTFSIYKHLHRLSEGWDFR